MEPNTAVQLVERSESSVSTASTVDISIIEKETDGKRRLEIVNDADKIQRTKRICYSPIMLDLKEILSSDIVGATIIQNYDTRVPRKLFDRERTKLTRDLINKALLQSNELRANDFLKLFEEIEKVFPTEILDTYFIACQGKMKHSTGRLPNYYRNIRPKILSLNTNIKVPVDNSIESIDEVVLNISEAITEINNNPCKSELLLLWKETSLYRIKEMKKAESLVDILRDWPKYKNIYGHELINIDFETAFPHKSNLMVNNWIHVKEKILNYMKETLRDDSSMLLLENISFFTENTQNLMMLKLLPKILSPPNRKMGGSVANARESYLLHLEDPANFDQELSSRRNIALQNNATVQPFLIAVGQTHNIQSVMISVDDMLWNVSSILEGFDVLFKTYMVFNLNYPSASVRVWTFVQRYLFNIKTENDLKAGLSVIATLANDLNLNVNE